MKRWIDHALLGLHVLGAALLLAMAAVILYDVGGRILFNRPFAGTAELVAVCLVLQTYLQMPYVLRHRQLLRVSFFVDRVSPRVRSQLNAFAYLCGAVFLIAIAITSWEPAIRGIATAEFFGNDAFRIAAWPLRFGTIALWVVGGLVCLGIVADGVRGRLTARDEAGQDAGDHDVP